MNSPHASVVIGFKDWGLDRLQQCIRSVRSSFEDVPVEVITSDYGSADANSVREATQAAGGHYVRTDTDGTWSRSRALNAGFASARGTLLFATDADMIFTPAALARVTRRLDEVPWEAIILQCRDLPPEARVSGQPDWDELARSATIRPRWGMGGLVGMHRDVYLRLRGYDERMHTYGGEDIDYGKRMRRWGIPINWFDEPGVRMYHVWHPSTSAAAADDPAAVTAIAHNRAIHTDDATTVRNISNYEGRREDTPPVVSVMVEVDSLTPGDTLKEEVSSLLSQSLTDIEVLLVGNDLATSPLATSLNDDRVRTVGPPTESVWWSAMSEAKGSFVVLHPPGALHAPERLARLVGATTLPWTVPQDRAAVLVRRPDDALSARSKQGVPRMLHPWGSLLVPRDLAVTALTTFPDGTHATDQWVYALIRNGAILSSLEDIGRIHVIADGAHDEILVDREMRSTEMLARRLEGCGASAAWLEGIDPADAATTIPTAIATLNARFDVTIVTAEPRVAESFRQFVDSDPGASVRTVQVTDATSERLFDIMVASGLKQSAVGRLRAEAKRLGASTKVTVVSPDDAADSDDMDLLLDELSSLYSEDPAGATWVIAQHVDSERADDAFERVERLPSLSCVLRRSLHMGTSHLHLVIASLGQATSGLETLSRVRTAAPDATDVRLHVSGGPLASLAQLQENPRR